MEADMLLVVSFIVLKIIELEFPHIKSPYKFPHIKSPYKIPSKPPYQLFLV